MRHGLALACALALLAGCGPRGPQRSVPDGIIVPDAPPGALVGGIYTGRFANDPNCCFAVGDAAFRVRKSAPATDLAIKMYIPDARTYRRRRQGFTATLDGRYRIDRCCFRPGLHTVLFPLPPSLRDANGSIDVALHMRETFVPAQDGLSREDNRRVSVVLVGARFLTL